MNQLYPQSWSAYLGVLIVFLRLLGVFILVPGFSHRAIPGTFKVLFALSVSLALYPILKPQLPAIPSEIGNLIFLGLRETILGLLIGFIAYITFEGIHLAAQFIGYQIGLGTVGLIDPVNHASVSPIVPFYGWMALMSFFVLDMHHSFLEVFTRSFQVTHAMDIGLIGESKLLNLFVSTSAGIFIVAIKMAAPVTVLILACNAAVGILARMLPQMHILLFTFPITIGLGLFTIYLVSPATLLMISSVLDEMLERSMILLRLI